MTTDSVLAMPNSALEHLSDTQLVDLLASGERAAKKLNLLLVRAQHERATARQFTAQQRV